MDTEKVIQLKKPLKLQDREITEITLREPTAGELDFAEINSKTSNGRSIQIIALVSGINANIIKQMGARDYKEAADYIASFLDSSLSTGEN